MDWVYAWLSRVRAQTNGYAHHIRRCRCHKVIHADCFLLRTILSFTQITQHPCGERWQLTQVAYNIEIWWGIPVLILYSHILMNMHTPLGHSRTSLRTRLPEVTSMYCVLASVSISLRAFLSWLIPPWFHRYCMLLLNSSESIAYLLLTRSRLITHETVFATQNRFRLRFRRNSLILAVGTYCLFFYFFQNSHFVSGF